MAGAMRRAGKLGAKQVQQIRGLIRGADRMHRVAYKWLVIMSLAMLVLPGLVEAVAPQFDGLYQAVIALVTFSFLAANYYIARTYRRTHPHSRGPLLVSGIGGILSLCNFVPGRVLSANPWLDPLAPALGDVGFIAMGSVTAFAIIKDLMDNRTINERELWGGIAVYILVGVIMSFAYGLTAELAPGSFTNPFQSGISQRPELLYFSFMAQTTVGFGDVVPISPLARSLTIIQGMFGMLYPPVIVARLVNLQVQNRP
jgi:hypothetical protein